MADKKNTPDAPAPEAPAEAVQAKGAHNPFAHGLLEEAAKLDERKEALFAEIGTNRDTLRMVVRTGFVSDEQAKAVAEFYPVRQAKAKEAPAETATATTPATTTA